MIRYEVGDDRVARLTLDRPEAKNALSLPMLVGMADAWEEIDGDDGIRCAVLTGAGGTFCSGMDLKSMSGPDADRYGDRMQADPDLHWKALLRHYQLRKPLIAAVEGWAVAGGTEILQATDIRVAGAGAKFGVFEARRGLFPLGGSTVRLRRQIPYTMAMDLLQAGVDRAVIALWLGHESVETTQIYLEATLAMKEAALAKTTPYSGKSSRFQPDDNLLEFLNNL